MTSISEMELLRIFVGESDKHQGKSLFEVIIHEAHQQGLAGATVLQGTLGFGASHHIHTTKVLRLSGDLPVVIEIVDQSEKIASFLKHLKGILKGGLVTLEKVKAFRVGESS